MRGRTDTLCDFAHHHLARIFREWHVVPSLQVPTYRWIEAVDDAVGSVHLRARHLRRHTTGGAVHGATVSDTEANGIYQSRYADGPGAYGTSASNGR